MPWNVVILYPSSNYIYTRPATVPYAPRWTWVGGISLRMGRRWRLNFDSQWVDDRYKLIPRYANSGATIDAYLLVNGRLGYQANRRIEIVLAAENLTDSAYEYRADYPMLGRTWRVGLDLGGWFRRR